MTSGRPAGLGSSTVTMGGGKKLGRTREGTIVALVSLRFQFHNGTPVVVIAGGYNTVVLTIRVKVGVTVSTLETVMVTVVIHATSTGVVYGGIEMVIGVLSVISGKMKLAGAMAMKSPPVPETTD